MRLIRKVVPPESTIIGGYKSIGFDADHINMIEFSPVDGMGLKKFGEASAKLVSEIR